jgi:predicted porin
MQTSFLRQVAAATVLLGTAGVAAAQSSVTIYGVIDIGIQTRNRAATVDDSASEVRSGNLSPSIWGFKGTEDLGGGTRAFFNLEGHFSSNTGGLTSGPGFGPQVFRRQANVGLSGSWGTLTLGRQYSPAIIATIGVEPRAWKENMSGLFYWAYNQLSGPGNPFGQGDNAGNDVGVFIGNALQYSNSFGPVWLGAAYSLGGIAGDAKKGRQLSLGLSYSGPVTVGFGYHKMNDSLTGEAVNEAWALGAAVPFGPLTAKATYMDLKDNDRFTGVQVSEVKAAGVGVDYRWSEHNTANATFYHAKYEGDADAKSKSLVLSNEYALSKRTTLFAQFAYIDAGNYTGADGLQFLKTSILADGQLNGKKTSVLALGMRHSF